MKAVTFNEDRRFGIELEAYNLDRYELAAQLRQEGINAHTGGYSEYQADAWTVATDASIIGRNAFELKSPILRGSAGLHEIRTVLRVVRRLGGRVNRSCGFHVHHDISDWGADQFSKFLYIAYTTDFLFRRAQPEDRWNNGTWCKPFEDHIRFEDIEAFDRRFRGKRADSTTWKNFLRHIAPQTRYVGINLQSYWSKGTVEFRHHSGTLNAEKIVAWVVATQAAVNRAQDKKIRVTVWKDPVVEGLRRLGLRSNGYNQPDDLVDAAGKHLAARYRRFAEGRTYTQPTIEQRRQRYAVGY